MQIRRFIAEQPVAIADTFRAAEGFLAGWRPGEIDRVLLVGSGSSLNANSVVAPLFDKAVANGAAVIGPTEFLSRRLAEPDRTLVVVLSQTGTSTTSIAAARQAHARGSPVLLVTANGEGPAARLGLPTMLMPIGEESIGPKTKGYVASCAALAALAARLGADVADPVHTRSAQENALAGAESRASEMAKHLQDLDFVLVAGDGPNYGTALEASLKIAEIAGVPSAAFTIEEALHGRLHGLTGRSLCMQIVSGEETRRQAARVQAVLAPLGVRVESVEARPASGLPAPWCAIAATFPFQFLAVELALQRGRNPDLMRYPGLTQELHIKTEAVA